MNIIEQIKGKTSQIKMKMFLKQIKQMNEEQLLQVLQKVAIDATKNCLKELKAGKTIKQIEEELE
jgi:hypothetical protein